VLVSPWAGGDVCIELLWAGAHCFTVCLLWEARLCVEYVDANAFTLCCDEKACCDVWACMLTGNEKGNS